MKLVKSTVLALAGLILLFGCKAPPETADTVVQKIIDAHGSPAAIKNAEGLLFHGTIKAVAQQDQGKVWILYRRPDKLRVIVEMENQKEDRLYLAGRGWRDTGQGFTEVSGAALDVMAYQAEHLDLVYGLLAGDYQVRLSEPVVPGETVNLVLVDKAGSETEVTVDPVRWVIRTVERTFDMNGQSVAMGVVYEEYRTVKGVQLPFRILNYVNGQPVGQTDFMSVQTNPSLPENVFSAPGKGTR